MKINSIILLLGSFLCISNTQAQSGIAAPLMHNNFTVVYDISINSTKSNAGIAETYNGGVKTIMMQKGKTRIRLVTLMRIQSIYFYKQDSSLAKVLITKESGKKKYKYRLSHADWKQYNARYDSITYTLLDDSINIAGYSCKKAIITIPAEGKTITAYYSTGLKPLDKYIEPMFAGLPGIVLKYEHEDPKGSITFTASKISFEQFNEKLLEAPAKGYEQRDYSSFGR